MNIKVLRFSGLISLLWILAFLFGGCEKEKQHFDNPYAGGKEPLGIRMSMDMPVPEEGPAGSVVTFKATGLLPYEDSLTVFINGETAEVVDIDSSSIHIRIPETASTGVVSLSVGDHIYFGPVFQVRGKLVIDSTFEALVGANRSISDYLRLPEQEGKIVLVGSFSDFNHEGAVKPFNHIVLITKDGKVDPSFNSGLGTDGSLNTIAALPNGKMVIGGGISSFDIHRGEIHNITMLNEDGSLDSMVITTFQNRDTVPAFNGGTDGTITKVFVHNNMITAVGRFNYYLQTEYDKSDYRQLRDSIITDSVRIRNIIRFFPDGSLDSAFNYDFYKHESKQGPNGPVYDAYMQEDGKLIMVGNFSQYNGENVNNIVRLNEDGSIDRSFKVGNGADDPIQSIRFNKATKRFIAAGLFHTFKGERHHGLVMLREDGTVDESFTPAPMENTDSYRFAQQLSNGLVIVNGYFKTYNGVRRGNFMVLDAKGNLAEGYNATGNFRGTVRQCIETVNNEDEVMVMLMGNFSKLGEDDLGNITRLIFRE